MLIFRALNKKKPFENYSGKKENFVKKYRIKLEVEKISIYLIPNHHD